MKIEARGAAGLLVAALWACGGAAPVRDPAPAPARDPAAAALLAANASGEGPSTPLRSAQDDMGAPDDMGVPTPAPTPADPSLPSDADLTDSWARVLLRANPGPSQYVAYELTVRGAAGVASHVRGFMGRREAVTRTELVARDELRRTFAALRDLGALDLPRPVLASRSQTKRPAGSTAKMPPIEQAAADADIGPPESTVPIYELSFRLAGRENTLLIADPYRHDDRRYAEFINLVRRVATAAAGEIGYHAPAGVAGTEGYLFVDSVPGAQVTVDGVQLAGETPILAYTLAPGSHTVVLENARLGLRREYKVRVQSGLTTSLEVDLR